jgi:two-component system NtrC family response regulator
VNSIDWPQQDLPSAVAPFEEMLIRRALARCSGNRSEVAKTLNINRQLLDTKLTRYGIEQGDEGCSDSSA